MRFYTTFSSLIGKKYVYRKVKRKKKKNNTITIIKKTMKTVKYKLLGVVAAPGARLKVQ